MKHIAIIGAGWLGLPLAKHLQSLGYQVSASRTSQQGVDELKQHDINGFICDLSQSDHFADTLASLHCDTVVGSFPPGFRRGQGAEYATQWQQLVNTAKAAHCKKVVMVSSTTVYPDRAETMDETKATLALALSARFLSQRKSDVASRAKRHRLRAGVCDRPLQRPDWPKPSPGPFCRKVETSQHSGASQHAASGRRRWCRRFCG